MEKKNKEEKRKGTKRATHLTFNGIPINGKRENFEVKLKTHEFAYEPAHEETSFPPFYGKMFGYDCGLFIMAGTKNVYGVKTVIHVDSPEERSKVFESIHKKIVEIYPSAPIQETVFRYFDPAAYEIAKKAVFSIVSNGNLIGDIVLSASKDIHDELFVSIDYFDAASQKKYDKEPSKIPKMSCDISKYVSCAEKVVVRVFETQTEITGVSSGKTFFITAQNYDHLIIGQLVGLPGLPNAKAGIWNEFLKSILQDDPPANQVNCTEEQMKKVMFSYAYEKIEQMFNLILG